MKNNITLTGLYLSLLVSGFSIPALADVTPVTAFSTLPAVNAPRLSPDGKHILMLRAVGETYHAVHLNLETGKTNVVMASDPEQFLFTWCRWANNERVVCSIRRYGKLRSGQLGVMYRDGRTTFTRLLAANADGSEVVELIPEPKNNRDIGDQEWNAVDQDDVVNWLSDDPKHVLIALNREDRLRPSLYKLNIYTNELTRVRRFHESILTWYTNRAGDVSFAAGYRGERPVVYTLRGGGARELEITGADSVSPPTVMGLNAEGDRVYVIGSFGGNYRALYEVDTETGKPVKKLFSDETRDVTGTLSQDRETWEPLMLQYRPEKVRQVYFNPEIEQQGTAISAALTRIHPEVSFVSSDDALTRFILVGEGNGTTPTYYLYDDEAKSLRRMATTYPEIKKVVEPRTITYEARDGRKITGYVATPDGKGPFPTVIYPHGGPWARDHASFDYWTQFFIDRGYAVLKMNFRGSRGYGDEHEAAGFDQWGLAMQDDVMDGLDWMVEQKIADPDRVCVVGGSYGGYVALVAAYKAPDRIRCAVSFAGVSNLMDLKQRWFFFEFGQISTRRIQDGASVKENSPIHQAEKMDVPLLIVHGDVDRSVMIEQSRELVKVLNKAKKPHIYIEQENGDHFLSIQSHRTQFFEAMDEFLGKYL